MIEFLPRFVFAAIPLDNDCCRPREPMKLPAPEVPKDPQGRERILDRLVNYSVALPRRKEGPCPSPHADSNHDETYSQKSSRG